MRRAAEERWHCLNRFCGNTLPIEKTERETESRLCECGSAMRKRARPAVFSYLNFLREKTVDEEKERAGKEPGPWER